MKAVIVTGATSGIGYSVCRELLKLKYHVIGVGHSPEKCLQAQKLLTAEISDCSVIFFNADLMQQAEIKRVSGELAMYLDASCGGRLYALINNAGCIRSWYSTTEDGYEQQFALNHLAGFLLTHYMLPYLRKQNGRILITSSGSHKKTKIRWRDIMLQRHYNPLLAYKQSKLCNMLFARALNSRYAESGVRAYGIEPGLVATEIGLKNTGGIVRLIWSHRMKSGVSPEIPAKTYAWICERTISPEGMYYYMCKEADYSSQVTSENAEKLFALSEQLCGIAQGRYGV